MRNFKAFILFMLIALSPGVYGQDSGFFTTLFTNLGSQATQILNSFGSVSLESNSLGYDEGIIAGAIVGTSRIVERNPNPTSEDDKFLVMDTMKIGLRLGAGLIVSGSASYVLKYTITYPAKTKIQGMWNNKFFMDMFLPYKVWQNKLPKKYVLMAETYLEGQARLKLGGNITLPMGTSITASKFYLTRNFISKKSDKKITVFRDTSIYNQLAQDVYLNLGLIDLPILEANVKFGSLDREYLSLDTSNEDAKNKTFNVLGKILKNNSWKSAIEYGDKRKVHTDFSHKYQYFNIAFMFTSENNHRVDDITDEKMSIENGTEILRRYQIENRRSTAWTIGFDGDRHKSYIYLSAEPVFKDGVPVDFKNPILSLKFLANDFGTKSNEIKESYIPMLNEIALNRNFIQYDPKLDETEGMTAYTDVLLNLEINEKGLRRLMELSEKDIWKELARETGKPVSYWKKASRLSLQDQRNKRMRQSRIKLQDHYLSKRVKAMCRRLTLAKKEQAPLQKLGLIVRALRQAIYQNTKTYKSTIIALLHRLVGTDNTFLEAEIIRFAEVGSKSTRKDAVTYTTQGKRTQKTSKVYRFFIEEAVELWTLTESSN